MFTSLVTKVALKRSGLSSIQKTFDDATTPAKPSKNSSTSTSSRTDSAADSALPFGNPFANVQLPASWATWATPPATPIAVKDVPVIGTKAPSGARLRFPPGDGKGVVVLFLRGGGCPFAEKSFLTLRTLANKHPTYTFIAISHASAAATEKWVTMLGGAWSVRIIVDETRELYAEWGLGIGNTWSVFSPWTWAAQRRLGSTEGIWARCVDVQGNSNGRNAAVEGAKSAGVGVGAGAGARKSGLKGGMGDGEEVVKEMPDAGLGNRWQVGGAWAVDRGGIVRWGGAAKAADDLPLLDEGVLALGG